jgi:hypothetical protein
MQGGQGMSTKVSGTTAGGQFFAAGAAPKDITLANEAAWGQLSAADGATAATTNTDGAAVEGGGAPTAAANGSAAVPAAEGGAAAPEGTAAAAAAGADGAPPPATGAAAAQAGASGDVPADDAAGKVMLTEFEQFNREQQRRQEALRKQVRSIITRY